MEENKWKDPHIDPNRVETDPRVQMMEIMWMPKLEGPQLKRKGMKVELEPPIPYLYNDQ